MYTIIDLYNSKITPKINDISLSLLFSYYKIYLHPYTYKITIDKDTNEFIQIRFPYSSFCHLLGIETIVKKVVNKNQISNYKGIDGVLNITNGNLSFESLKKINKLGFKNIKDKFVFFYLIPLVLESKKAIYFDSTKVINSKIKSDIIFYDNSINSYIHIGVTKSYDNTYVPKTFFVERITKNNNGLKFIEKQDLIEIEQIGIIKNNSYSEFVFSRFTKQV